MKQISFIILLLCSFNVYSQTVTIDKALDQGGNNIGSSIQKNTVVAILAINSFSNDLSDYIMNGLTTSIVHTGNLKVVSRQQISQILKELNFQISGYVDDNSAQRIGKTLGAQTVIIGSIMRVDNIYRLNIQCLHVESALIQVIINYDIRRDNRMKSFENTESNKSIKPINFNFDSVNLFKEYSPFTTLTMFGYNYANNLPLGFTLGWGLYTTWNFRITDWQGYSEGYEYIYNYNAEGKIDGHDNYTYRNRTTNFIMDAVFGYNLSIIPRFLYIPVGFGFRYNVEYRLYDRWNYNNTKIDETSWHYPAGGGQYSFLFETGIVLKYKLLYVSATYRFINDNTKTNTFSLGVGICEDFGRIDKL